MTIVSAIGEPTSYDVGLRPLTFNDYIIQLIIDLKWNINFVEAWYSLEQYIGLKEDKLSSTTVDFIRSEGNLETKRLYWFSKPKMC